MAVMRYLAIDLGDKRTGVAVGDDRTRVASPVEVITTTDRATLRRRLQECIEEHGPDALVIGLPLNMDGSAGPAAQKVRQFAAQLHEQCGLPVHEVDERLSSHAAEGLLQNRELTRGQKKQRRDALAAAVLLQDFLRPRNK